MTGSELRVMVMSDPRKLNTTTDFELTDGTVVPLTLTFGLLLKLRSKSKEDYARFNRVIMEGPKDVMDSMAIIYAAYLCAYIDDHNTHGGALSEEEFLELCPFDIEGAMYTSKSLINPKAKRDSDDPS